MSPVLTFSEYFTLPIVIQRIFNYNIQILSFSCYQFIYEHFGVNRVTVLPTTAKLWCIKLCAIFFWTTLYTAYPIKTQNFVFAVLYGMGLYCLRTAHTKNVTSNAKITNFLNSGILPY